MFIIAYAALISGLIFLPFALFKICLFLLPVTIVAHIVITVNRWLCNNKQPSTVMIKAPVRYETPKPTAKPSYKLHIDGTVERL